MRIAFKNARIIGFVTETEISELVRAIQKYKFQLFETTLVLILQFAFFYRISPKQNSNTWMEWKCWLTSENEEQNEAKHSRNQHHTERHDYCSTASQLISCSHQTLTEHTVAFIKDKTLRQIHSIWHIYRSVSQQIHPFLYITQMHY